MFPSSGELGLGLLWPCGMYRDTVEGQNPTLLMVKTLCGMFYLNATGQPGFVHQRYGWIFNLQFIP